MKEDVWKAALSTPKAAACKWLKSQANVSVIDCCGAPKLAGNEIQVHVMLAAPGFDAAMRANGKDCVFVRPFFAPEEEKKYAVVPLQSDVDLASAMRQAEFLGEQAWGVVPLKRGFGVRVRATDYAMLAEKLRPDDHNTVTGEKYEVSGLPLASGPDTVKSLLGNWAVTPLHTFRQGRWPRHHLRLE